MDDPIQVEKYKIDDGKLMLTTGYINYKDESIWNNKFDDQEEIFALHRWNWLLTALTNNTKEYDKKWGLALIRSWINIMMVPKKGLAWTPYTTGERISNACLFLALVNKNEKNLRPSYVLPD